jgi:hypothetical protein
MTLRFARRSLLILGTALFLVTPSAIYSCGPFFEETIFSFDTQPETSPEDFAAGKLGIIRPGFRRAYLAVAYRYLSGLTLTPEQQRATLDVWNRSIIAAAGSEQHAVDAWNKARAEVTRMGAKTEASLYAPASDEQPYEQFLNCTPDAFRNAVSTLNARLAKFGSSSETIREWVLGQDDVFANCRGGGRVIPAVLSSGEPLLVADRNYQIAAAHFYAGDYDEAANQFDGIAKDASSPWSPLGSYLAARSLIRKAVLNHAPSQPFDRAALSAAQERLERIVNDPHEGDLKDSAARLLNFIRFRTEPEKRVAELDRMLISHDVGKNFRQDLWDYLLLLSQGQQAEDPSDWLQTFYAKGAPLGRSGKTSVTPAEHAIQKWREEKSLPWLVAALTLTDSNNTAVPDLLASADKVPAASPAYLTVRYQALRLRIARGQTGIARKELDERLKQSDLPLGVRNLFNEERQKIATGFDDFLRHAAETAVGATWEEGEVNNPSEPKADGPYFNHFSAVVFTKRLPLLLLAEAARSTTLPQNLRREVARTAWLRSVLIEDDFETATKLQPVLHEVDPALWNAMEPFWSAKTANAKRFVAIFLVLNNPGLKPSVREGALRSATLGELDEFRDNWWCADMTGEQNWGKYEPYNKDVNLQFAERESDFPFPLWESDKDRGAARREWQKLGTIGTAPNYLAAQVLAYAKDHEEDERVPQALHLAVRATHIGCTNAQTTQLSKAAFNFLHEHHPKSEWAAKTKYYY